MYVHLILKSKYDVEWWKTLSDKKSYYTFYLQSANCIIY